jgi:hypothetical protein
MILPFFSPFCFVHEAAIVVANWKVQKAAIYNPSLQKNEEWKMVG